MSVLNQMLMDLERRRARPAGTGALASYVRPLPLEHSARIPAWTINAAAAIVIGTLAGFAASHWLVAPKLFDRSGNQPSAASGGPQSSAMAARPQAAESAANTEAARVADAANAQLVVASIDLRNAAIDVPVNELGVFPAGRSVAGGSGSPDFAAAADPERRTAPTDQSKQRADKTEYPLKGRPDAAGAAGSIQTQVAPTETGTSAGIAPQTASASARIADERAQAKARNVRETPPNTTLEPKGAELELRVSAAQRAENDYRRAVNLLGQERNDDARAVLARIVSERPEHDSARQALIGLLIQAKKPSEAESLADERLARAAEHTGFAMIAARLKFERGELPGALETLQRSQRHAQANGAYIAFMAAVLQRLARHGEAVEQYRNALKLNPVAGAWLMGLGMSLQSLDRGAEAREAFSRARDGAELTPDLKAYIDQRIAQLDR